jgi:hypothetical protein
MRCYHPCWIGRSRESYEETLTPTLSQGGRGSMCREGKRAVGLFEAVVKIEKLREELVHV